MFLSGTNLPYLRHEHTGLESRIVMPADSNMVAAWMEIDQLGACAAISCDPASLSGIAFHIWHLLNVADHRREPHLIEAVDPFHVLRYRPCANANIPKWAMAA